MNVVRPILALLLGIALLGVLAVSAVPAQGQYTVLANTTSEIGPLDRSEWVVQATPDPLSTFRMTRLVRDVPLHRLKGAIFFLPSLGTPFALYEQRDTSGAFGTSIAEFFALRGYDVYGYSPRYEGIPAGVCEAGFVDCSGMVDWDLQSLLDDIAYIRGQIEILNPGTAVAAGGTSLGGILATALADAAPHDYVGLFPWEGMLFTPDPAVTALNQGYCAGIEAQIGAGLVFDGVGGNILKRVVEQSTLAPQGLNTIPFFPPFLTAHQVLVAVVAQEAPGPVSMPVPGYVAMTGSLAEDRLFFASEKRLADNVRTFASVIPNPLVRDISCSLAGVETAYVDNLGAYTGSVLAIGGGFGFGAYMQDQLDQLTGADITFLLEPEFGHIDHFMTPRHRQFVERPILRWLRQIMP